MKHLVSTDSYSVFTLPCCGFCATCRIYVWISWLLQSIAKLSVFHGVFFTPFSAPSIQYTWLMLSELMNFTFLVQFSYRWQPSVLPIIYKCFSSSSALCIGKELSLLFLHGIKTPVTSPGDLCLYLNSLIYHNYLHPAIYALCLWCQGAPLFFPPCLQCSVVLSIPIHFTIFVQNREINFFKISCIFNSV